MSSFQPKDIKSLDTAGIFSLIKENQTLILSLTVVALLVDTFFVKTSSDFVIFGILILYGIFAKVLHLKSNITFLICLGLLVAMFVSYLFSGTSVPTEKAAVWLFLFMALGIFQQWRE